MRALLRTLRLEARKTLGETWEKGFKRKNRWASYDSLPSNFSLIQVRVQVLWRSGSLGTESQTEVARVEREAERKRKVETA